MQGSVVVVGFTAGGRGRSYVAGELTDQTFTQKSALPGLMGKLFMNYLQCT